MKTEKMTFDNRHDFVRQLEELMEKGIPAASVNVYAPYPVHEVEEILKTPVSPLRFFTLIGALSGLIFGALFTSLTSLNWPLIGGGKPIVSLPAFIIVIFELTILFGGVISFIGFLLLSRLPSVRRIVKPVDHGNQFVIEIHSEDQ